MSRVKQIKIPDSAKELIRETFNESLEKEQDVKIVFPNHPDRKEIGFYFCGKEVSWEDIPIGVRMHDYDYYYRDGMEYFPFKPDKFDNYHTETKKEYQGHDEAAEELFETIEINEHENIFDDTFKRIFKAGAKWMAEQGVSKECTIGMATKEIICKFTEETLNKLDVCPSDKVMIQIRKQ